MNPSTDTSSVQSPLDKPLSELTEDDIAQLTREDCRRFLKQKGMRRPSWNKSQAIQQVISLKALLEDRPDSALYKSRHHPTFPPPPPPPPVTSPQQVSVPSMRVAEDPSPYRRKDPNPIPPPALFTCPSRAFPANEGAVVGKDHQLSPSTRRDPAQMTIFYGGRMNVYNDVPVEKARAIMQLASSPVAVGDLNDPPPEPVHARRTVHPCISIGPGPNGAFFASSPVGSGQPEWTSAREMDDTTNRGSTAADCATGRQASLQRYLEKRKDRYKGKRIIGSPSSMEMIFLSQKFRGQTPNEQWSQSNTSSPSQPRPPCTPTRCSSIENQAQKFRLSVDLNDDGGGN